MDSQATHRFPLSTMTADDLHAHRCTPRRVEHRGRAGWVTDST